MMGHKERLEAEGKLNAEGLPLEVARSLTRLGSKLHKLAEASCNGDYPADNGQRIINTCPLCESGWAPESFHYVPLEEIPEGRRAPLASQGVKLEKDGKYPICPDCWTERQVRMKLKPYPGFTPVFGGDPRGAVLVVQVPSGKYDNWERSGIVCG